MVKSCSKSPQSKAGPKVRTMANFVCQLDWPRVPRLRIISGCVCESSSGEDEHLNQRTQESSSAAPVWVGGLPSTEGLRREQKGEAGGTFSTFFLPRCRAGTAHYIFFCPETGIHTISSSSSQEFAQAGLNPTTGFPGAPARRRQIVGWDFSASVIP